LRVRFLLPLPAKQRLSSLCFFNDKTFHQNPSFSIAYSEKEGGVGMSGFFGGGKSGGFGTLFLLLIIIIIFFSAGVDF
jgi:hypothetical protein